MVDRLRAIGNQTVDPEAFANQAEAPAPDHGGDEIADVSQRLRLGAPAGHP